LPPAVSLTHSLTHSLTTTTTTIIIIMQGFLTSITDKAQSALNQSPISQHIPASLTGSSPSHGASSTSTDRNYTLEQIQHQFRQLQQNYS
jgi:hypothetical protein